MQIYHSSYTSAINTALEYATEKGYQTNEEEVARTIGMGKPKPAAGDTNRITVALYKDGKEQKKCLHLQVYNMGERYELNVYIS
jgi:hypothetical protein